MDAPNSAVWGGITGDIADQTDLQDALSNVGKVDSVNGIEPDVSKNVQVDVELTKAEYDALPISKESDDVNYWIKDGTNIPQASVISASGVQYDNTTSGLTADTVQDAIDENASDIADLNSGLKLVNGSLPFTGGSASYKDISADFTNYLGGYVPVALAGYALNSANYFLIKSALSGNVLSLTLGTKTGSFSDGNVNVTLLCVSSAFTI